MFWRRYALLAGLLWLAPECHPRTASPTSQPCPPEPASPFHVERRDEVARAYELGHKAVTPSAQPTDVVRRTCDALDPATAPFCYEGVSHAYARTIIDAARRGDPRAGELVGGFAPTMEAIDPRWASIHCRGLAQLVVLDKDQLDPLLPLMAPRCRGFLAELAGRFIVDEIPCTTIDHPKATPACREEIAAVLDEKRCAGTSEYGVDRAEDLCAFGIGRGLGNAFPGQFELVATLCRGPRRGGCLAGVGYVATYLYTDRMEQSLALASHLPPGDRASYLEGVANALAWRERSDPDQLKTWIAALPPHLAQLANAIRDSARRCGLYDYGEGAGCRWPVVETCSR